MKYNITVVYIDNARAVHVQSLGHERNYILP